MRCCSHNSRHAPHLSSTPRPSRIHAHDAFPRAKSRWTNLEDSSHASRLERLKPQRTIMPQSPDRRRPAWHEGSPSRPRPACRIRDVPVAWDSRGPGSSEVVVQALAQALAPALPPTTLRALAGRRRGHRGMGALLSGREGAAMATDTVKWFNESASSHHAVRPLRQCPS